MEMIEYDINTEDHRETLEDLDRPMKKMQMLPSQVWS